MNNPIVCYECSVLISDPAIKPQCKKGICTFEYFEPVNRKWSRKVDRSKESEQWQQPTPMPLGYGPSYSHGISALDNLLQTLNAQHSQLVGIFSDLLNSSPPSIGADVIIPEAAQVFASFAKHQQAVEDLRSHALDARDRSLNTAEQSALNIGVFSTKR